MTVAPVVRAVTVDTVPDRAFAIFADRIADWWPLATHTSTDRLAVDLAFIDGALVEISPDGERCIWGTVTEWDPPRRLALTWAPTGGPVTSVSVEFEGSDGQTRVVLRHDGWEAYGDRAQDYRDGYDGDYAWGWVLDLFAFAAHGANDQTLDAPGSGNGQQPPTRAAVLRRGYEDVALALERGPFGDPEAGEWTARQVAGHVSTNAELLCAVVDDVTAGRAARLYGPDDHVAAAIGRYNDVDFDEAAGALRRTSAGLVARYAGLTDAELATSVSTYIEHRGNPIVDGPMSLGDLFAAQIGFHLPAHVGQIADLRVTESAAAS